MCLIGFNFVFKALILVAGTYLLHVILGNALQHWQLAQRVVKQFSPSNLLCTSIQVIKKVLRYKFIISVKFLVIFIYIFLALVFLAYCNIVLLLCTC